MTQRIPKPKRTFTFTFSTAGLLALLLFTIIALAWAFILGLLLGRGYKPEELIPEIAQVMPTPQPPGVTETLRPEDLNFYEQLKNIPLKDEKSEEKDITPLPSQPEKQTQNTNKEEKIDKKSIQKIKPIRNESKIQPKEAIATAPKTNKQAEKKTEPRYSFHYQLASLKDGASAIEAQKRLQAKNFKASINKIQNNEITWYRLFVTFEGTDNELADTKAKLQKLGFGNILLIKKKPLE